MTSNITSRAACLAELTSNPKSFFNCPDMHGGCGSPEPPLSREPGDGSGERRVETLNGARGTRDIAEN